MTPITSKSIENCGRSSRHKKPLPHGIRNDDDCMYDHNCAFPECVNACCL